jgi:hypothetical protein
MEICHRFIAEVKENFADIAAKTDLNKTGPDLSLPAPKRSYLPIECYPCRKVSLNYSDSLIFHGGNTGSIPVRDANILSILRDLTGS